MEPFDGLLAGYVFQNNTCVECGTHGAAFATPCMFSACPQCLAGRIRALKATRSDLPQWVLYLEGAAEREVRRQAEAERRAFTVTFDDLNKCVTCGRLFRDREGRYRCSDCYGAGPN